MSPNIKPKISLHYAYFRSVRTNVDIKTQAEIEHSYHLRRNNSFYIHILNDESDPADVKRLFLSDFYTKVLNAVALTRISFAEESFAMWTKSPCDSVAPKLTNVWTKSTGIRKDKFF